MTDQIKALENMLAVNAVTSPRTPFLNLMAGGLKTALDNGKEHLAEMSRQCEARRLQVIIDQEALQKLQAQVAQDTAMALAASTNLATDQQAVSAAAAAAS